jgi:hypothetical protein
MQKRRNNNISRFVRDHVLLGCIKTLGNKSRRAMYFEINLSAWTAPVLENTW